MAPPLSGARLISYAPIQGKVASGKTGQRLSELHRDRYQGSGDCRDRLDMNRIDPWRQIVSSLHSRSRFAAHLHRAPVLAESLGRRNAMTCAMANALFIRRIEWKTTSTILVSWSDPTLGRYEDQSWRAGFAHTTGICRLTGMPVRPGDAVFRPRQFGGTTLTNALDMILADALRGAEETACEERCMKVRLLISTEF